MFNPAVRICAGPMNTANQGRTRPNFFQLFAWTYGNRNFAFRSVSILSKWNLRPASVCRKTCNHLLEALQIRLEGFQPCVGRPATVAILAPLILAQVGSSCRAQSTACRRSCRKFPGAVTAAASDFVLVISVGICHDVEYLYFILRPRISFPA